MRKIIAFATSRDDKTRIQETLLNAGFKEVEVHLCTDNQIKDVLGTVETWEEESQDRPFSYATRPKQECTFVWQHSPPTPFKPRG
jgi:hypothetical protein